MHERTRHVVDGTPERNGKGSLRMTNSVKRAEKPTSTKRRMALLSLIIFTVCAIVIIMCDRRGGRRDG